MLRTLHFNSNNLFALINNLEQIHHLLWISWGPNCIPAQLPTALGLQFGVGRGTQKQPPRYRCCAKHRALFPHQTAQQRCGCLCPITHTSAIETCFGEAIQFVGAISKNPACSLRARCSASLLIFPPNNWLGAVPRLACLHFGAGEEHQKTVYNICFVPSDKRQEL